MAERNYRIRIVQDNKEFEVEGDKVFVLEMLKRFDNAVVNPATPNDDVATTTEEKRANSSKPVSVREFLRRTGIKRHTDIVLAFGYYLEKYSDIQEFTPADINKCYYEAKIEASNTSQMVIQNLKRGYIMESKGAKKEGKKRYTLTQSGEDYINNKLNQKSKK